MKLAPILAQYLYERKRLPLPGIGIFTFDSGYRTEVELKHASQGISFQTSNSVAEDEDLINYISAQTGKMKPLASSDLESYLELARQFLNIGKPFHIEGIGTLVKTKGGNFDFTADHLLSDKVKETGIKELSATSISDHSLTTYESLKPQKESNAPYRKIFLLTLIVITTGIIIFGGYWISKTSTPAEEKIAEPETQQAETKDTNANLVPPTLPDSTKLAQQTDPTSPRDYRFVIETAKRNRALYRYDMLKKGGLNIQMSTDDSVIYKIFFVIKATPNDTARIADSLTVRYPALNHQPTHVEL